MEAIVRLHKSCDSMLFSLLVGSTEDTGKPQKISGKVWGVLVS